MACRAGGCHPRRDGAHQPGSHPARQGTGRTLRNPAAADGQPRGRAGGESESPPGEDGVRMELSTDSDYQNLLGRISQTYNEGRLQAYQSVNAHMTETYWKIGHDIVEYEQGGKAKAD